MKLYLIRHGETDWNKKHLYQGQGNRSLTSLGKKEAQKLAQELKSVKADTIFASDLKRAAETAKIVNSFQKLPIQVEPLLREINFGKMEGKPHAEVLRKNKTYFLPNGLVNYRYVFPDGESWQMVHKRIAKFFRKLKRQPYKTVFIVCHQGTIKAFLYKLMKYTKHDLSKIQVPNCGYLIIDF